MKIKANGLELEVEDSGADGTQAERPVVLLISGLGLQLTDWPPALVQGLQDAGFRVVRFDNRDAGLSTHLDALGVPNLLWVGLQHRLGLKPRPPYTLEDMARDALGVLDALGIARAHVVGMSMGGMIAQRVALLAPERVLSLTSIMSSSGARGLPGPDSRILKSLLQRPPSGSPLDWSSITCASSPPLAAPTSMSTRRSCARASSRACAAATAQRARCGKWRR